jgi:hypothetical protein
MHRKSKKGSNIAKRIDIEYRQEQRRKEKEERNHEQKTTKLLR